MGCYSMSRTNKKGCVNMKIQAVLIDGYKNLSNVKISFDNITALVALNNFGKSNVLSGIDFGLSFIKANVEEKQKMMSNSNLIPINRYILGKNFEYQMEVSTEFQGQEYLVQYGYEFEWALREDREPKIVSEFLKIKLNEKGQKFTQLVKRTQETAVYKSSETGRCSSKIKVDSTELIVNKLRAFDELFYAEIITKLNRMKIYMENNLDAKSFYQPDPFIRRGLEDEMINADSLPRVIFNLKQKNPDKFELLMDVYVQLFPNVEDIIVREFKLDDDKDKRKEVFAGAPFIIANSFYLLFVKDRNLVNPVNFEMMSDGAKRVFMILTKIIVSSLSNISLIAVEEPENSVHPSLFRAYMQIISQLLDDCKVIITSHSPYIISYLNPSWLHIGINRIQGVAEFFTFKDTGKKQLQKDAAEFNMRLGDYLFSMLADTTSNIFDYLESDSIE